jgi:glycosyltransferase involved in cell wall biosynthesis
MKLAVIAPGYPYRGGISHFATRLAMELSRSHECLYINFRRLYLGFLFPGKTQYDDSIQRVEFDSRRIIESTNPLSWRRAGRIIREWGAEALIFHWWHPFFGPAYRGIAAAAGMGIPRIAVCHNVAPHEKGGLWRSAVKFGLQRMSGFIVHARQEANELKELLGDVPALTLFHPVYDIFPGEDMPKSTARERLGLSENDRVVLYFGLIRPYKGVEVLLDAAGRLKDVPGLKILIVGEIYANRQGIMAKLRKLPPDMVKLVDRYVLNEEVAVWFRAADIVALPYLSATQSGIVPIAYRCHRPVIVTRVGGLPDVVEEGVSGYLVEPADPEALAMAIRRHFIELHNPDMSVGIEKLSRSLSWERYAVELIDFMVDLGKGVNAEI